MASGNSSQTLNTTEALRQEDKTGRTWKDKYKIQNKIHKGCRKGRDGGLCTFYSSLKIYYDITSRTELCARVHTVGPCTPCLCHHQGDVVGKQVCGPHGNPGKGEELFCSPPVKPLGHCLWWGNSKEPCACPPGEDSDHVLKSRRCSCSESNTSPHPDGGRCTAPLLWSTLLSWTLRP